MLMIDAPADDAPISAQLVAAVRALRGTAAADQLCAVCVQLLSIDAAAISLVVGRSTTGTFGASSATARAYSEVQFNLGEGPCLDSIRDRHTVGASDLGAESRWPAYTATMLSTHHIVSVYAIPVVISGQYLGALNVYRHESGPLPRAQMAALLMAAELATMPLLDLLGTDQDALDDPDNDLWTELGSVTRSDVNLATGMLIVQLGVGPAEALVRLRAHAYATGVSASETARNILDRRVRLGSDQ